MIKTSTWINLVPLQMNKHTDRQSNGKLVGIARGMQKVRAFASPFPPGILLLVEPYIYS